MKAHIQSPALHSGLPQVCWQAGALVTLLFCTAALAEPHNEVQLTAEPNRCISLHQGQTCYQQVRLSWQTPAEGQFCLHVEQSLEALLCWQGATRTSYNFAFEASTSTHFEIRPKDEKRVLGTVKVQVASVYKTSTRSHSRWRLF